LFESSIHMVNMANYAVPLLQRSRALTGQIRLIEPGIPPYRVPMFAS
jgi:hypothetical protein